MASTTTTTTTATTARPLVYTKKDCTYAEATVARRIFDEQERRRVKRLPGLVGVHAVVNYASNSEIVGGVKKTIPATEQKFYVTYDALETKGNVYMSQKEEAYRTAFVALASLHALGIVHLNLAERKFGVRVDEKAGTIRREWVLFDFKSAALVDLEKPGTFVIAPDSYGRLGTRFGDTITYAKPLFDYFRRDWRFVDWVDRERSLADPARALTQEERKRVRPNVQDFVLLEQFFSKSIKTRAPALAAAPEPKFAGQTLKKIHAKLAAAAAAATAPEQQRAPAATAARGGAGAGGGGGEDT